jgi:serine/threonine protein kinase
MAQVCQGLHRAHKQNLIHRDVKPDNILLTADGIAKLTDLGLVKDVEGEMNLTRTGRGLGTPHFMAPEQFRNAKSADIRCDIYSLGATLYMMVTGKMPFDGCGPLDAWMKKSSNEFPAPREIDPTISERMDWAIRRAMHASPESRPATCREFIEDVTGQSTRPSAVPNNTSSDLWYMIYRDDDGTVHTVKGTTENIRKAYREGLLGDASNIRACRTKQGPFQSLQDYPEFRDMVVGVEPQSEAAAIGMASSPVDPARRSPPPGNGVARLAKAPVAAGPMPAPGPTREWNAADRTEPMQIQAAMATPLPSTAPTAEHAPIVVPNPALGGSQNSSFAIWLAVIALAVAIGMLSIMIFNK